jgi:predicted neutral ceramidase superfamily lipid hydrolase
MSTIRTIRDHAGRAHKRLNNSPAIMWFLGGLVLLLWGCATVVQIQTSEYLAMGTAQRVSHVAWNVFAQPYLLVTGQAPADQQTAWMYGWIVEACTLIVGLALVVAFTKIGSVNSFLAKVFVAAAVVLVVLNSWADFTSSPGANDLVRFLIALAIGLIVTCGLPLGIGLIEYGCEQY